MIDCACAILVRGERLLLAKRSPHRAVYPDVWDVVGGKREPGEDIESALIRETQEEIDVTPRAFRKLGTLAEPQPERHGARCYHIYLVTDWDGPGPRMLGDEHSEIRWVTIEEALSLDVALAAYRDVFERLRCEGAV